MTITEREYEEIDSRIQAHIEAALDKHSNEADTEKVLRDARLSSIEDRLSETRVEVGSLRSEMIDMRQQLTILAVNIEKAKNVGTYLAVAVTFLSLVALFLGIR